MFCPVVRYRGRAAFLVIWRFLGVEAVSPEDVTLPLLKFMQGRRSVATTDGWTPQLCAGHIIFRRTHDRMWLSRGGRALERAFDAPAVLKASPATLDFVE